MPKIETLNQEERTHFDTPPKLKKVERDKLFNLPEKVFLWLNTFESNINQVPERYIDKQQEIQHSSKEEQGLVVGCQRLIQNAITLWNELCLSQKLSATQDEAEKKGILKIICNGSTIAWQHLNLHGEYDFTWDDAYDFQFDMEKILSVKVN